MVVQLVGVVKKQSSTALSSTEAEYIAISEAAKESVWIRKLMKDLNLEQKNPIDNLRR